MRRYGKAAILAIALATTSDARPDSRGRGGGVAAQHRPEHRGLARGHHEAPAVPPSDLRIASRPSEEGQRGPSSKKNVIAGKDKAPINEASNAAQVISDSANGRQQSRIDPAREAAPGFNAGENTRGHGMEEEESMTTQAFDPKASSENLVKGIKNGRERVEGDVKSRGENMATRMKDTIPSAPVAPKDKDNDPAAPTIPSDSKDPAPPSGPPAPDAKGSAGTKPPLDPKAALEKVDGDVKEVGKQGKHALEKADGDVKEVGKHGKEALEKADGNVKEVGKQGKEAGGKVTEGVKKVHSDVQEGMPKGWGENKLKPLPSPLAKDAVSADTDKADEIATITALPRDAEPESTGDDKEAPKTDDSPAKGDSAPDVPETPAKAAASNLPNAIRDFDGRGIQMPSNRLDNRLDNLGSRLNVPTNKAEASSQKLMDSIKATLPLKPLPRNVFDGIANPRDIGHALDQCSTSIAGKKPEIDTAYARVAPELGLNQTLTSINSTTTWAALVFQNYLKSAINTNQNELYELFRIYEAQRNRTAGIVAVDKDAPAAPPVSFNFRHLLDSVATTGETVRGFFANLQHRVLQDSALSQVRSANAGAVADVTNAVAAKAGEAVTGAAQGVSNAATQVAENVAAPLTAAEEAAYKQMTPECKSAFDTIILASEKNNKAVNDLLKGLQSRETCTDAQDKDSGLDATLCMEPTQVFSNDQGVFANMSAVFTNNGRDICNLTFRADGLSTAVDKEPAWLPDARKAFPEGAFPGSGQAVTLNMTVPWSQALVSNPELPFNLQPGAFTCGNKKPEITPRAPRPIAGNALYENGPACFKTAACAKAVESYQGDDCATYQALLGSSCSECETDVLLKMSEDCKKGKCSEATCKVKALERPGEAKEVETGSTSGAAVMKGLGLAVAMALGGVLGMSL